MAPKIETPKTFIVIASPDDDAAWVISKTLTEDKMHLHEKFNGAPVPPFLSMMNHFDNSVNKEEIIASAEAVLNDKKNFMMVLSGYQDNDAWNEALNEFMGRNNVSATFLSLDGSTLPENTAKHFHVVTDLSEDDPNALPLALSAIKESRDRSAVPFEEAQNSRIASKQAAAPRLLH